MPGDSPSCYLSSCHWLCSDAHHLLSRLLQWYFHWTFFLSACPVLWLIASLVPTLHISVIESFIHLIMAYSWAGEALLQTVSWVRLSSTCSIVGPVTTPGPSQGRWQKCKRGRGTCDYFNSLAQKWQALFFSPTFHCIKQVTRPKPTSKR